MNNLKQIGLAFVMYADDYDGWYPRYFRGIPYYLDYKNATRTSGICDHPKCESLLCPSNPAKTNTDPHSNYVRNSEFAAVHYKISQIKCQSKTIHVMDGSKTNNYKNVNLHEIGHMSRIGKWHSGGFNILFVDGHVGWYTQITDFYWKYPFKCPFNP